MTAPTAGRGSAVATLGGPTSAAATLTVDRLAGWLLIAVVLDLLVTRFAVRLAMFIPKEEPWATPARLLGRIGAVTDTLVPIVGLLLLVALVLRAIRVGAPVDRLLAGALVAAAAGGLLPLVVPPGPQLSLILGLLVAATAVAAGLHVRRCRDWPRFVRPGVIALAASVALGASGHALGAAAALGGTVVGALASAPGAGALAGVAAQAAFVVGAALAGLGGLSHARAAGAIPRGPMLVGVLVALALTVSWMRAPASLDSLAIWSTGLSGVVPVPLVAVALGLVIAGMPPLHRRAPLAALGASIVLASGVGLAASGLVLSALLGLVVVGLSPVGPRTVGQRSV